MKAQVHEVFILLVQKENLFTLKAIPLLNIPIYFILTIFSERSATISEKCLCTYTNNFM